MKKENEALFAKCIAALANISDIGSAERANLRIITANLALIYAVETHGGPDDPIWELADIDAPMMM